MKSKHQTFSQEELDTCLGHYDLGELIQTVEFRRGSQRSPKMLVKCRKGSFLLKRRAKAQDDLVKVIFSHKIQLLLTEKGYPLPRLVPTIGDGDSMLVVAGDIYELFEFVDGGGYDGSGEASEDAGRTLGLYHKLLEDFKGDYGPPTSSYHDAEPVRTAIAKVVASLPLKGRPSAEVLNATIGALADIYGQCCGEVNKLGLSDWRMQIVHGDWHPGNMLFKDRRVVAVLDYDAARFQPRAIDLANGALHFSITGGGSNLSNWPVHLDQGRFRRFMNGYISVDPVSPEEISAVPRLMCESIIAEAALPIAATGSFGRYNGFAFLEMIRRKAEWILANADKLAGTVGG